MGGELHQVILCLGSNRDKEANMERATEILLARFPHIRLSVTVATEPVDSPTSDLFLNRVALLYSELSANSIVDILKEIEMELGRKRTDKLTGSIPIDIDLIAYDDMIVKPNDMERDYVISGIESLLGARYCDKWGNGKA